MVPSLAGQAPRRELRSARTGPLRALPWLLAAALLGAALLPGSAGAQVSAGPLRAELGADPWQLRLADGSGATVLEQHPGLGAGPTGALGFRTAGGWAHATRVVSGGQTGGSYAAELETTDPARNIAVTLEPAGDGVIRLIASIVGDASAVEAIGIGFQAQAGERYLGFGERSNAVDQRGGEVESYVADGPYEADDRVIVDALIPDDGFRYRDDATYFPMPWLLSTAGYGVLLDNTEPSHLRLGSDDAGRVERRDRGDGAGAALRRRPAAGGRAAAPDGDDRPPASARGAVGPRPLVPAHGVEPARPGADAARPRRTRLGGQHLPRTTCPAAASRGVEAQQPARTAGFHDLGFAVTTYFNPMICVAYSPAYGAGGGGGGADARTRWAIPTSTSTPPARRPRLGLPVRLLDAGGRERSSRALLAEAVGHGYDGWMEDFGEYTPLDSVSANGMDGAEMHNLYPQQYHCASWEYAGAQPRPLVPFIRSGWTGVHPCAQVVWGGDPTTDWGFDGIDSAIKQALSLGTSGISRWGSDIGGFFSLVGDDKLTPEMLIRWVQLGAVSGVMRTEANGVKLNPDPRPQIFDGPVLPVWRRYAKLRTQLYPYLVAAEAEYRRSGMPLMRHLALTDPGDPAPSRARTSSCSARTCSPRPCASRARLRARSTSRRAAGSTSGGRSPTARPGPAPCACGARGCSPGDARRACRRRSPSCR